MIYTDEQNACAEYTEDITDVSVFPSTFVLAFSLRLAHYGARKLTKGDPFKMKNEIAREYNIAITTAASRLNNEEVRDEEVDSEFIRVRS